MRNIYKTFFITFIAVIIVGGCRSERTSVNSDSVLLRNPMDRVEDYLKLTIDSRKREEAYEYLTPESRKAIPVKDFKALLRDELRGDLGGRSPSDIRIRVEHLRDFVISNNHQIIYSLVRISFPYDEGMTDRFRLTRFHVHRIGDVWYVEPFIHAVTFTKRLLPALLVGTESELQSKRGQFYDIIGEDLLAERRKIRSSAESESVLTEGAHGKIDEVGSLIVPDLRMPKDDNPMAKSSDNNIATDDEGRRIKSLLAVGRLYFQTGNIVAAEASFQQVLILDPENTVAKNYMERCGGIRRLQEEKRKEVELIERLLELEEEERRIRRQRD